MKQEIHIPDVLWHRFDRRFGHANLERMIRQMMEDTLAEDTRKYEEGVFMRLFKSGRRG